MRFALFVVFCLPSFLWASTKPVKIEVKPSSNLEQLSGRKPQGIAIGEPHPQQKLPSKIRAKSLDSIMKRATAAEKKDLMKVMSQIELIRIRTNDNGRTLFKVRKVTPGSVFSRTGVKPGDYVFARN